MKSGFIKAKPVVIGQGGCNRAKWLNSREVVFFGQKWLYSGILVVIRNVVVFRHEVLYSGKSGCIRAKVVVFGQYG